MDSGPVASYQVHEHLRPKVSASICGHLLLDDYFLKTNHIMFLPRLQLCDLYENDSIFDKFECCLSGDGLRVATGSYRFLLACVLVNSNTILSYIRDEEMTKLIVLETSNLFRVFGASQGSTEAATLEASKNPMR